MKSVLNKRKGLMPSLGLVALVVTALGCTSVANEANAQLQPPAQTPKRTSALVNAVSDGDTVRATLAGGKTERIRLWGIDAPEDSQAFGKESGAALRERVLNKKIEVEEKDRDRYGRLVAILYIDGKDVNLEMIKLGLAWWYRQFAPDRVDYREAELEARRTKAGLWKDPNPTPPWDFRRQNPR